ncbi:MAG: hypothetical protein AB1921_19375 [Thermodesulfobacteriota bacterium]
MSRPKAPSTATRVLMASALLWPFFLLAFFSLFFPETFFGLAGKLTPFEPQVSNLAPGGVLGHGGAALGPVYALLAERLGIELLVRVIPFLPGIGIAFVALCVFSLLARRTAVFFPLALGLFGVLGKLYTNYPLGSFDILFAGVALAAFWLNFSGAARFPEILSRRAGREKMAAGFLLFPGISLWLLPVAGLIMAREALFPARTAPDRYLILLGRLCTWLWCFLALSCGFFFFAAKPPSPNVSSVLPLGQLYGVFYDSGANQLYVTSKCPRPIVRLDADHPGEKPKCIFTPATEIEDLCLERDTGKIFLMERSDRCLLVVDGRSGSLLEKRCYANSFTGSTKLCLLPERNMLIATWENGGLQVIDSRTLEEIISADTPPNMILVADREKGFFFGTLRTAEGRLLVSLDPDSMKMNVMAQVPDFPEHPALSTRFGEIYLVDPPGGKILAFPARTFGKARALRSEPGVRALALDEGNGLLLAASTVTGNLSVLDIASGKTLARYHVGPYCRDIAVVPGKRTAYVTLAFGGLFKVSY